MTQVDIIRKQLAEGNTMTQRSALLDFGIMALPRRIADLRERGFPIKVEMKTNPHTGQRYASYSMEDCVTDSRDLVEGAVYKMVDVYAHPFHPKLVANSQGYMTVTSAGVTGFSCRIAGVGQVAGRDWLKNSRFKLKYIGGMN